jgi:branched-chain amino acid transport system ATP-binding protein
MLRATNVTKRFGGVVALSEVTIELRPGEILGLIGPNGSGKTTLFNVISGIFQPDAGSIALDDADLTGGPPYKVARAGIARTYQIVKPLSDLTVRENTAAGACFGRKNLPLEAALVVADRVLAEVGLAPKADALAAQLNLPEKKRLELARALASEPTVLLLDEVLAGLNPTEVAGMVDVIQGAHHRGIDIIIVEHVMQAIVGLCDRICVLETGRLIAEGDPQTVLSDERVITAYLGDPKLLEQFAEAL